METNTESSFLFPCSSGWLEAGAGVRAALTMGDGVERGREGQSTQRPGGTHTSQELRRAQRYLLISHRYCSLGIFCTVLAVTIADIVTKVLKL